MADQAEFAGQMKPESSSDEGGQQKPQPLAELKWNVRRYTFWDKKREFSLHADVYPFWCLFAVEHGSFAYGIGDAHGTAGGGSIVLCPPSVPFVRSMLSPFLSFHFVQLQLEGTSISAEGGESGFRLPRFFTPGDRQRLFDTFERWKRIDALKLPDPYPLFTHYWRDIWNTWCLEETHLRSSGDGDRHADELMNHAAARLKERCAEPFSVKELADELNLSPVQLVRRFRAAYKMTPGDYLTRLRMERACRLLRETRMTVEQIAASCGYATGYYLSRLFASRIGVTPSEYRKRHRV